MAVQANYEGDAEVILESAEVWELNSCWINETTALQILEGKQQQQQQQQQQQHQQHQQQHQHQHPEVNHFHGKGGVRSGDRRDAAE